MVLIYLEPNRQNTHRYIIHSVCLFLMICILELTVMVGKYKYKQYFMFVPCINSIKALFYYSKLMHTIIKS